MPSQNYRQAKRHRENSRKKRQLEKQERKMNKKGPAAQASHSPPEAGTPDPESAP